METEPKRAGARRWCLLIMVVIVTYVFLRDGGTVPYDDALFFKRVGLNAVRSGSLSFNLTDGPVHGSTSQLQQGLVVALTALAPAYTLLLTKLVSALLLLGLCAVFLRWAKDISAPPRDAGFLIILTLASPLVLTTIATGMETALALLLVGVSLLRVRAAKTSSLEAAMWTTLVYSCRPDAAAIVASFVVVQSLTERKSVRRYLLSLASLLGLYLLALWAYYGSALPLPFFVKTQGLSDYGANMQRLGWVTKAEHFGATLFFSLPLLFVAAHGQTIRAKALLFSTGTFWIYHLIFTNEIMGYHGRFYAPGLVSLGLAAVDSGADFSARMTKKKLLLFGAFWIALFATMLALSLLPPFRGATTRSISPGVYGAFLGLSIAGTWARSSKWHQIVVACGALLVTIAFKPPRFDGLVKDAKLVEVARAEVKSFRGLRDLKKCMTPLQHLYHSELGVPGLVFPETRVVDLVGLWRREGAFDGDSFERACRADQPEAIFLPHQNYQELNRLIRSSPCFQKYHQVTVGSSPLFIRDDRHAAFERCRTTTFPAKERMN